MTSCLVLVLRVIRARQKIVLIFEELCHKKHLPQKRENNCWQVRATGYVVSLRWEALIQRAQYIVNQLTDRRLSNVTSS